MKRVRSGHRFHSFLFCVATLTAVATVGCGEDEGFPEPALSTPTGMAVAGSNKNRLFVANAEQDSLVVATFTGTLDENFRFEKSAAVFFPLRLTVGPAPKDLAATPDGRFVVVLDLASDALRLVDADALRPVGDAMSLAPPGPEGGRAVALVGSPKPCGVGCAGTVFVSLAASGVVVELEVRTLPASEEATIFAARVFAVGGSPGALAVSPDGNTLLVADSEAFDVARVDVNSGAVDYGGSGEPLRNLGALAGPLAFSTDGRTAVVGRGRFRDVLVFDGADAAQLVRVDIDQTQVPTLRCLPTCGDPDSCPGSHPADLALCATGLGLETQGTAYDALYLDEVPVRMIGLGEGAGMPQTRVSCTFDEQTTVVEYSEVMAVALLNGVVRIIGLRREAGGPLNPELASLSHCEPQTLGVSDALSRSNSDTPVSHGVADLFAECPDAPNRSRLQCTDPAGGPGIVFARTSVNRTLLPQSFSWEGVLFSDSTGQLVDASSFRQPGNPFDSFDIRTRDAAPASCAAFGFADDANTVKCLDDCTGWDISLCTAPATCGDGVRQGVEQCDGTDFGGQTCLAQGFAGGNLACNANCSFNLSTCVGPRDGVPSTCGNENVLDPGEACDGTALGAVVRHHGDILELLDAPSSNSACNQALAALGETGTGQCRFERRIVGFRNDAEGSRVLELDRPLPLACFRETATLGYQVRVGDAFTNGSAQNPKRLPLGEVVGLGADLDLGSSTLFRLRGLRPFGDVPACERYQPPDANNQDIMRPVPPMNPVLTRGLLFQVAFGTPTDAVRLDNAEQGNTASVGTLPVDVAVGFGAFSEPVLFVSYAGSDNVWAVVPFDTALQYGDDRRQNLR